MTGQLTNLNIHIQTLREEINVQLVVTMVLEEIDFIRCHGHFTVVILKASFINDETAIGHEVFAEVGFLTLESTGNTEVRPDLPAFLHILLGKVSGIGGFTSAGDTEI